MTREQVLDMSDQELAEATAVHVMGWKLVQHPADGFDVWATKFNELGQIIEYREQHEWNPADDIRDAWEVLKKVQKDWSWEMNMNNDAGEVEVRIASHWVVTSSVAESICKAALLAVMGI